VELNTLVNEFKCWDLVLRLPRMNVLPSTLAFKTKCFPDGTVKKFKAHFFAQGDHQKEGIDFFEMWAPVVQWLKIRIVIVLAAKLGLHSVQCDITVAFIHGGIPPDKEIYVHQPHFKHSDGTEALCLQRTLYGLCQSPQYFFKYYFTKRLVKQGLTPSCFDLCLFLSSTLIVITYVDSILIYGHSEDKIDDFIAQIKTEDVTLNKEGATEGYPGVDIQHTGKQITFTQIGLTKQIILALGLNSK
jgi:hypothetical protein